MNNKDINVLALAYLGDSVYEIYIREYLIKKGIEKVKNLQEEAIKFVSAKSQASFLKKMIDENFFTEEELSIV
jgi:ribonuclease-3 family protein